MKLSTLIQISKGHLKWKENLNEKAAASFLKRRDITDNLKDIVYGDSKNNFS